MRIAWTPQTESEFKIAVQFINSYPGGGNVITSFRSNGSTEIIEKDIRTHGIGSVITDVRFQQLSAEPLILREILVIYRNEFYTSRDSFNSSGLPFDAYIPMKLANTFPTGHPTKFPTFMPTGMPTRFPTSFPTGFPTPFTTTPYPSRFPTRYPTKFPSRFRETRRPSPYPTPFIRPFLPGFSSYPSSYPTLYSRVSRYPTQYPTRYPTPFGFTLRPTKYPTGFPTRFTRRPTKYPTRFPSRFTTRFPTKFPTPFPLTRFPSPNQIGNLTVQSRFGVPVDAKGGVKIYPGGFEVNGCVNASGCPNRTFLGLNPRMVVDLGRMTFIGSVRLITVRGFFSSQLKVRIGNVQSPGFQPLACDGLYSPSMLGRIGTLYAMRDVRNRNLEDEDGYTEWISECEGYGRYVSIIKTGVELFEISHIQVLDGSLPMSILGVEGSCASRRWNLTTVASCEDVLSAEDCCRSQDSDGHPCFPSAPSSLSSKKCYSAPQAQVGIGPVLSCGPIGDDIVSRCGGKRSCTIQANVSCEVNVTYSCGGIFTTEKVSFRDGDRVLLACEAPRTMEKFYREVAADDFACDCDGVGQGQQLTLSTKMSLQTCAAACVHNGTNCHGYHLDSNSSSCTLVGAPGYSSCKRSCFPRFALSKDFSVELSSSEAPAGLNTVPLLSAYPAVGVREVAGLLCRNFGLTGYVNITGMYPPVRIPASLCASRDPNALMALLDENQMGNASVSVSEIASIFPEGRLDPCTPVRLCADFGGEQWRVVREILSEARGFANLSSLMEHIGECDAVISTGESLHSGSSASSSASLFVRLRQWIRAEGGRLVFIGNTTGPNNGTLGAIYSLLNVTDGRVTAGGAPGPGEYAVVSLPFQYSFAGLPRGGQLLRPFAVNETQELISTVLASDIAPQVRSLYTSNDHAGGGGERSWVLGAELGTGDTFAIGFGFRTGNNQLGALLEAIVRLPRILRVACSPPGPRTRGERRFAGRVDREELEANGLRTAYGCDEGVHAQCGLPGPAFEGAPGPLTPVRVVHAGIENREAGRCGCTRS